MARLMVWVPGGTRFGTETLAIAHNSLGSLHLAGAAWAGTGRRRSHHQHTTPFLIDAQRTKFHKKNQFRDESKKISITILIPTTAATLLTRSQIRAINSEAKSHPTTIMDKKDQAQQTIQNNHL